MCQGGTGSSEWLGCAATSAAGNGLHQPAGSL